MKTVRLIFGICFVVGLGLLVGGYYSIQHTREFLRTAVEAPGVVTENLRLGELEQRPERLLVVLSANPLPHQRRPGDRFHLEHRHKPACLSRE